MSPGVAWNDLFEKGGVEPLISRQSIYFPRYFSLSEHENLKNVINCNTNNFNTL